MAATPVQVSADLEGVEDEANVLGQTRKQHVARDGVSVLLGAVS